MMDDVYKKSQSIMYVGDKENANTDSAPVSDEKEPYFNQFNKELYQKFFSRRRKYRRAGTAISIFMICQPAGIR